MLRKIAHRCQKVSILAMAGVVAFYQLFGSLAEWAMTGSLAAALQDVRLGLPGMLLQVVGGYAMFVLGMLLNYFLIFPFTFRFLGTYQVNAEVVNMITLESYMDTLLMLSLMMGILFELPMVCWLLGKLGILTKDFMRHYRRHAIVAILVVAAVITPTSDIFTLTLVSLPIWLLYEASILFVPREKIKL